MYILGILMHTYKNVIKISNQKYTIANIKCCIDYRVLYNTYIHTTNKYSIYPPKPHYLIRPISREMLYKKKNQD